MLNEHIKQACRDLKYEQEVILSNPISFCLVFFLLDTVTTIYSAHIPIHLYIREWRARMHLTGLDILDCRTDRPGAMGGIQADRNWIAMVN